MLKFLIIFVSFFLAAYCREVCYDDLGCFTDKYPFSGSVQRPIAVLPQTPEKIATKFILYNKHVPNGEVISIRSDLSLFDSTIETKFLIHGFLTNPLKDWVFNMKNSLLKAGDFNVVIVDWSKGNRFPYTQATANTQVVGAEIARLIKYICDKKSVQEESFHLIGHSLGSHISGYAGKRLTNLGRITGLDPAGPYFENTDPVVRLDVGDAKFVDVIHTDGSSTIALGLGLMQPLGHADYYPNGGKNQPDCPATAGKILDAIFNTLTLDFDSFDDTVVCSHNAAIHYFADTLENKACRFSAFKCSSQKDFEKGNCLGCSSKGCNRMGFYSSDKYDLGELYLNTQSFFSDNYCKQFYRIKLVSNTLSNQNKAKGKITVYLTNGIQTSATLMIDNSEETFRPGTVGIKFFDLDIPLDYNLPITSVFIGYRKTRNVFNSWMYDDKWSFSSVELLNGDNQVTSTHCPVQQFIESDSTVEFKKC